MKRILFSFAHPDDESFTIGGLLSELAEQPNVETIVYSATLGDAGKCGNPPVCKKEDLATVRLQELTTACQHLGVTFMHTNTFPDGKLSQFAEGELINELTNLIEKYKPEVVVTFPPDGISGHPDHTAISKATLKVAERSPHVKRLYYVAMPSMHNYDLTFELNDLHLKNVKNALLAHKTQHLSIDRVFPTIYEDDFKKFDNKEYLSLRLGSKSPNDFI